MPSPDESHPWKKEQRGRSGRKKKRKGHPKRISTKKEKETLIAYEEAVVGYGVRLRERVGSLRRYALVPLPEDPEGRVTAVKVLIRYPEGVVERMMEVERT